MRLSHADIQAVSEALRELYAHTNAATLPHQIVRLARRLIPAHSAAYQVYDFRSKEMQIVHDYGPEADRYLPILNEYMAEHPILVHLQGNSRAGATRLSDVISHRDLRDTAIYCEFFRPLRVEIQMSMLMEDRQYAVSGISMQRDGGDFSARDREVLTFLQPHLVQAYKNASDFTAAQNQNSEMKRVLAACDLGVAWLSGKETVEWMSSQAELWLECYFRQAPRDKTRSLPVALGDWIRSLKAAQERDPLADWKAERTFTNARGHLHIRWVSESPERSYLIFSEQRTSARIQELLALGLTLREAEVLHWIAEGKSNEAIAIILGAKKRTVEKHVEHILAKLSVESRVQAAMLAAEHRTGMPPPMVYPSSCAKKGSWRKSKPAR